jgi:hypothetical protein
MSFVNLSTTISTITAACVAHAEKQCWDLHAKDNIGFYTWKKAVWWPEMAKFITHYMYNKEEIESWGLFDRMDAGMVYNMCSTSRLPYEDALRNLKLYLVMYMAEERLFKA